MGKKRQFLSLKNSSISTSISLMMILAALAVSVIIGMLSYAIYRDKHFNFKAMGTLDVAESVAAFIDGDKFKIIAELDERTEYQREIQAIIVSIGLSADVTHLYAIAEHGDGLHYRYIFDASGSESFGRADRKEGYRAGKAFDTGESVTDQFYDTTNNYGDMISCFAAIRDSGGNVVGVVGADNILSDVISEVNDFAELLVTVILSLNILFVIVSRLYISRVFVKPLISMTKDAERIADGDLSIQFGEVIRDEQTKNELTVLRGTLERMLIDLNEKHALKLEAMEAKYEKEELERASEAKNLYFARMSHEIRTPMNAVTGISELLLRKELPQDVYEHAQMIKNASVNLLAIINDVLDFSKMESGKLEITESEYSFVSLVSDVINVSRMRIIEKPIQFAAFINPNIPERLIGDEVRLRQVIMNLLNNAAKYTDEGFISLSITGTAEYGAVELKIEVSDSGIGIREEDFDGLFGDFTQLDATKNKGIEGSGLGLAIAHNLCRLMNGDISVSSEYGKGSVFTATIPQRYDSDAPFASIGDPSDKTVLLYESREIYGDSIVMTLDSLGVIYKRAETVSSLCDLLGDFDYAFIPSFVYGSVSPVVNQLGLPVKLVLLTDITDTSTPRSIKTLLLPAHARSVANILNGYQSENNDVTLSGASFTAPDASVLIVDDVATNLKVGAGLLSPYEMQVSLCSNGAESIKLIAKNRYDLVFMDHMMPGMDGLEATRRIREMEGEYFKNLPIIALTANAVSGIREMFIQNGMNDFLSKPIETAKLDAVLAKWIPKNKRERKEEQTPVRYLASFTAQLKAIPDLSVDKALATVGGMVDLYEDVVRLSASLLPESIDKLTRMAGTDWDSYTIEVHGIKSSLNNIGAYGLAELAQELEDSSRDGKFDVFRDLHSSFIEKLKKLRGSLDELIQSRGNPD